MMMLTCEIAKGALPHLKAFRLRHLEYIAQHREIIMFGGPARDVDGMPETMVIVLATPDRAVADAFIAAEPYAASGVVFASINVRPWSQVIPEPHPGALADDIAAEIRRQAAAP
jgi:uncharacterized protein